MKSSECQLHSLQHAHEPIRSFERVWQFRYRMRRFAKRRSNYLRKWLFSAKTLPQQEKRTGSKADQVIMKEQLKSGDIVLVRSWEEIQATLNNWNSLKGCTFMEEMKPYCGTTQRIYKRVERFLDERDYLVKKCSGIFILEGIYCNGTVDFGKCDRTCFFFWREEWLEII